MSDLAMLQCVPCKGGTPPLRGPELDDLLARLGNDWRVAEEHHLEKEFRFKNFREALDFTNRVGDLAEEQGHHPDIYLAWGKVRLTVWTHKIRVVDVTEHAGGTGPYFETTKKETGGPHAPPAVGPSTPGRILGPCPITGSPCLESAAASRLMLAGPRRWPLPAKRASEANPKSRATTAGTVRMGRCPTPRATYSAGTSTKNTPGKPWLPSTTRSHHEPLWFSEPPESVVD